MGANAIRTSHYPRSERFCDLCDKYGLYVWTELPLVDATTDSAAFRSNALHMAREMVLQHRRHRCIAMWGLFNELYLKKMPDGQADPHVWGSFAWVMFDCGSDNRREGGRDGLNDQGLVGFDHKTKKPAYDFYRKEWCQ